MFFCINYHPVKIKYFTIVLAAISIVNTTFGADKQRTAQEEAILSDLKKHIDAHKARMEGKLEDSSAPEMPGFEMPRFEMPEIAREPLRPSLYSEETLNKMRKLQEEPNNEPVREKAPELTMDDFIQLIAYSAWKEFKNNQEFIIELSRIIKSPSEMQSTYDKLISRKYQLGDINNAKIIFKRWIKALLNKY